MRRVMMRPALRMLTGLVRIVAVILAVVTLADPALAQGGGQGSAMSLESGTGRVMSLADPAANIFVADPNPYLPEL